MTSHQTRRATIEHFSAAPAGIVVGLKPAPGFPAVQLLVDPDLAQEFGERFGVRHPEAPENYDMQPVVGLAVEYAVNSAGTVVALRALMN